MRLHSVIGLFIFYPQNLLLAQQNLIPNPDFEAYYNCDFEPGFTLLQDIIPHWTARKATPDYLNNDCINDYHEPFNGSGYVKANHSFNPTNDLDPTNRREYPQVTLLDSLYAGKNYYLEYYMRLTFTNQVPASAHGVYFSDTLILDATDPQTFPLGPVILEPQLEIDTIFGSADRWQKAWFCYTPDQNYSVATFGNFRSGDSVEYVDPLRFGPQYSYDAFYLIEVPDTLSLVSMPNRDTICVDDCVTLASNHSRLPGDFLWDLPGSNIGSSTDSVVTVCYDEPGVYSVGLSADHCHGSLSREWPQAVVVLPRPEPVGGVQSYRMLRGESLALSVCDTTIDWSVSWSPDPGLSCLDCPAPVFSGTSSVQLWAAISINGACTDTCFYDIEVVEETLAQAIVDISNICLGSCFQITNNSLNATNIRYGPPEGPFEIIPGSTSRFTYCPSSVGDYELMLIAEGELNTDTAIIANLVVDNPPVPVQVPLDYSVDVGELVTLPPAYEADLFFWDMISGQLNPSCSACSSVRLDPFISGQMRLTASRGVCADTAVYTIDVSRQDPQIYLPTAFSPNFDGINDDFRAYGKYFTTTSLEIYDRYGGLLHSSEGPDAHWDGYVAGRPLNAGVYVYILRYRNIYGESLTESGAVTVMP